MPITVPRNFKASSFLRWNELRPMIDPNPPPSRMARASSNTCSSLAAAPPEKITIRCPLKALCTTWWTRSERVPIGICCLSYTFLASGKLDLSAGKLHFYDIRAELGRDLRGIGDDVDRCLSVLGEAAAARIGPDHDGKARGLRLGRKLAKLLIHGRGMARSGVDGEADGDASKMQRIVHARGHGRQGILLVVEHIVVVAFEDQRDVAGVIGDGGLDEAQRRGVAVAACLDGELEMVVGIVAGGIGCKASRGAVLETLVDRQDDELAGSAKTPVIEQPGDICPNSGTVPGIPA